MASLESARAPARERGDPSLPRLWAKRSAAAVRRDASLARDLDVSREGDRAARGGDDLRAMGSELSFEHRATRPDVSDANSRSAPRKCPSRGNACLRERYLRFLVNEVTLLPPKQPVRCAQLLSMDSFLSYGWPERLCIATNASIRRSQLVNRVAKFSRDSPKLSLDDTKLDVRRTKRPLPRPKLSAPCARNRGRPARRSILTRDSFVLEHSSALPPHGTLDHATHSRKPDDRTPSRV
jgi:hypothetical protein